MNLNILAAKYSTRLRVIDLADSHEFFLSTWSEKTLEDWCIRRELPLLPEHTGWHRGNFCTIYYHVLQSAHRSVSLEISIFRMGLHTQICVYLRKLKFEWRLAGLLGLSNHTLIIVQKLSVGKIRICRFLSANLRGSELVRLLVVRYLQKCNSESSFSPILK